MSQQEEYPCTDYQRSNNIVRQRSSQSKAFPFLLFIFLDHVYNFRYGQIITFLLICAHKCYRQYITRRYRLPVLNGGLPPWHFFTNADHLFVK